MGKSEEAMPKLPLSTRFTEKFGLRTPLALAPMAGASGGVLAGAWAKAGGLGLVGGGYGDPAWVAKEYGTALAELRPDAPALGRLGCGFITWKLNENCAALDWLLDQEPLPSAIMLSFGDPLPWASRIIDKSVSLICQIQRADELEEALAAGASVIVAQGTEAGGHGIKQSMGRSTFTLVPEIADKLQALSPDTLLLAAGGVTDGRGLAAALMLGADGALIGSRAWATRECLASDRAKAAAIEAGGDDTMRSSIFDILRRKNWPEAFDFRSIRNAMHLRWEGREEALRDHPDPARAEYDAAVSAEDYSIAHLPVGEGIGTIHDIPSAAELLERINAEAAKLLAAKTAFLVAD
jgi:nitronate monooxygenase